MAEPKTKPTDEDPNAFVAAIDDERRRADTQALLKLFTDATGEKAVMWGPSIVGFGSYTYINTSKKPADWPLVAFSPRKAASVLYGMNAAEDPALLERLGKYTTSGGCLHVKKLADVDWTVLRDLIAKAFAGMKARHTC